MGKSTLENIRDTYKELGGDPDSPDGFNLSDTESFRSSPSSVPSVGDDEALDADTQIGPVSQVSDQAQVNAGGTPPAEEPLAPPSTWSADAKAEFAKVPRSMQQYLLDRDREATTDYTRKTQELSQMRRTYADIDAAFRPYVDEMARNGVTPGILVSRFLGWDKLLKENFFQGVSELAATHGYTPQQLVAALSQQQSPVQLDPATQAIQSELAENRAFREHYQRQQALAQEQQMTTAVEAFATAKDASGNPLRPHFTALHQLIGPLACQYSEAYPSASFEQCLDAAYRQLAEPLNGAAAAATPAPAPQPAPDSRKVQHARNARAAGSSISGGSNGPIPKPRVKNTLDAVYQAADQLNYA